MYIKVDSKRSNADCFAGSWTLDICFVGLKHELLTVGVPAQWFKAGQWHVTFLRQGTLKKSFMEARCTILALFEVLSHVWIPREHLQGTAPCLQHVLHREPKEFGII